MITRPQQEKSLLRKTCLDNGMVVASTTMPHTLSASISLFVGVGSRNDPSDQSGISHVIEHVVFKGTAKRPVASDVSGSIEGMGGMLNAGTEQEFTVYWSKVAQHHVSEALDLHIDMLRNSLFNPTDIQSEIRVVIEEQNMAADSPSSRVDLLLDQLMWPDHPLGREISGSKQSVSGLTKQMLLDHMSTFYVPQNMVVSIAGQVDHDSLVLEVDSLTNRWGTHEIPPTIPFAESQDEPQLCIEYRDTEQAHLGISLRGLSATDPDRYALSLLSVILGEGMSSRLFVNVREERGLAYDIHSGVDYFQDCGTLGIYAGVDPKNARATVDTIMDELALMRNGVTEEELQKAQRLSTGLLMLGMEDTRTVSSWVGIQQLIQGDVLDVSEVIGRIESVTVDDIYKVANNVIVGHNLNLAVVGPVRGEAGFQKAMCNKLQ